MIQNTRQTCQHTLHLSSFCLTPSISFGQHQTSNEDDSSPPHQHFQGLLTMMATKEELVTTSKSCCWFVSVDLFVSILFGNCVYCILCSWTSCHNILVSSHLISPASCLVSCNLSNLISSCLILSRVASCCLVLPRLVLSHLVSSRLVASLVMSLVASRLVSLRLSSCLILRHISHCVTSRTLGYDEETHPQAIEHLSQQPLQ